MGADKNECMAKIFAKITQKLLSLSPPLWWEMGKTVKMLSAIDKNEFWGENFFEKVTFVSPGPDLALNTPGVLRLEVLQGLSRNYFVFCLKF